MNTYMRLFPRIKILFQIKRACFVVLGFWAAPFVDAKVASGDIAKSYIVNKAFNGTSDYIDKSADLSSVSSLSTGSISARFKSTDAGYVGKTIISASRSSVDSSEVALTMDTATIHFQVRENGTVLTNLNGSGSFNDGYWHVAVITVDGTGTNMYVDGVLTGSSASTSFFSSVTSKNGLWIGKNVDSGGSQWYYKGDIAEVTVYNRALTATEAQEVSYPNLMTNIADGSTKSADIETVSNNQLTGTVGYLNNDSSPTSGSISTWGYSSPVAIDYVYTSVVIDLQASSLVNRIDLWDTDGSGRGSGTDYAIYKSDNNTTYTQVTGVTFSTSTEGGLLVHHFDFADVTARYIKVHSLYSDVNYTFVLNPFQQSVRAYGINYSRINALSASIGYLNNDTSPTSGAISTWGYSSPVAIDYQYTSVVADLGSAKTVNEVDLWDGDSTTRGDGTNYALYKSDNNSTYTLISGVTFNATVEGGKTVHRFSFADVTARYIKVHSLYSDVSYTLVLNPFQQSVRAFRKNYANSTSLPRAIGYLNSDTSPTSGAIGNWGYNSSVALDYQYTSVGIDLGAAKYVTEVTLLDTDNTARAAGANYALYESDDNTTYTQIPNFIFNSNTEEGRLMHHFSFSGVTARYIKIHTLYSDASYTFLMYPFQTTMAAYETGFSRWTDVSRLWDGGTASGESVDYNNSEGYVEYDFGSVRTITQARFIEDNSGSNQATDWKVQQWNGSSFVDIFTYVSSGTSDWQLQTFNVATDRIRLYVRNTDSGGHAGASEFQVLAPLPQKNIADEWTTTTDSGWTGVDFLWDHDATSVGSYNEAYDPDTEGWVEYDFGSEKTLTAAHFIEDNNGNYQATDWKVQQWNGSAFVDAFSYVSSDTEQWQAQPLNVSTSKIRLYVKNTNGSGHAAGIEFEATAAETGFKRHTIWTDDPNDLGTYTDAEIVAIPNGTSIPRLLNVSSFDSASDYLTAMAYSYSDDMGVTWSTRTTLPWDFKTCPDSRQGMFCCAVLVYHATSGKVILLGEVTSYDSGVGVNHYPAYAYYDPSNGTFSSDYYFLSYPYNAALPANAVPYVDSNGDIYWPIRVANDSPNQTTNSVRIVKCTFNGTTLTYVSQSAKITGTALADNSNEGRAGGECALTKFNNVYYLAIRDLSTFANKTATSTDLATWNTPVDIGWDYYGAITGATNTQMRWVTHSDDLYLVYTRESQSNPDNTNVFRNRAPLWMAKFDTATQKLIKSTERPVIGMDGDDRPMASGFSTTSASPDTSFVATCEDGEGTKTLITRINWDVPNTLSTPASTTMILDEQWTSLSGWSASANPAISPAGQVRVYSTNGSSQYVYRTDKSIPGIYTAKWRVKVDSYKANETCVLTVRDGAHLLQLRLESDGLYVLDTTGSWYRQKILINDYNWHELQVYAVNGKATVLVDGDTQFTYDMRVDTGADRIELWTTNGDFNTDYLKIW